MEDNIIKEQLFDRSEQALNEISEKYSKLYRNIFRTALNNESDIEECENDLLLTIWNNIPPDDPDNLSLYICTIARRIGINKYKHNTRQKRGNGYTIMLSELGECIPNTTYNLSEEDISEELGRILTDFLKSLDPQTRVLFIRRYFFFESIASIAERFGIRENTVSVKLLRARSKLRKILKKEGLLHE